MQQRSSKIHRQATSSALSLVVVLVAVVGAAAQSTPAAKLTVLYSFKGAADGCDPHSALVLDKKNNLYGTTLECGPNNANGEVFKLDTSGKETALHGFTGGADGAHPEAGLTQDKSGMFYGTATVGGDLSCNPPWGCGTVFKLSKSGKMTVLHAFNGTDGYFPISGVVQDAAGNFYVATEFGGSANLGVLLKLNKSGKETILHNFTGAAGDGAYPADRGTLVRDVKGNLYGTTYFGGDLKCDPPHGCGIVFRLDPSGKVTVLYTFKSKEASPIAGLIPDAEGNLYGTTTGYDCESHFGDVFKLDTSGKETILHTFSGKSDGGCPQSPLLRDVTGNLYGTTAIGGTFGFGVVFKLDRSGKETVLHTFTERLSDGETPFGGLIWGKAGTLYGTTTEGGAGTVWGTVFKLELAP
jgi:uncharacterized repeat protein (TIGR03803 family)